MYPGISKKSLMMHTWVSGLATGIEKPSRRAELASYCLTYALEGLYQVWMDKGYVDNYPNVNLLVLSLCLAVFVYKKEQQPDIVIKFIFGVDNKKKREEEKKMKEEKKNLEKMKNEEN